MHSLKLVRLFNYFVELVLEFLVRRVQLLLGFFLRPFEH